MLVDQRKYYEYVPGILRLFCDPSLHKSIARPMPTFSSTSSHEFVHGCVKQINAKSIVVHAFGTATANAARTTTIAYDHIIIATGADYRAPITPVA